MTMNVNNNLVATILSTEDDTGNVPINRGCGDLAFDSNFGDFFTYRTFPTGSQAIFIPGASPIAFQLYVRNLDPTHSVFVEYTPFGGVLEASPAIGPGDVFIIWQNPTNTNAGFIKKLVLMLARRHYLNIFLVAKNDY